MDIIINPIHAINAHFHVKHVQIQQIIVQVALMDIIINPIIASHAYFHAKHVQTHQQIVQVVIQIFS